MQTSMQLETLLQKMCDAWDDEKKSITLEAYFELLKEMLKTPAQPIRGEKPYVVPGTKKRKNAYQQMGPDDQSGGGFE